MARLAAILVGLSLTLILASRSAAQKKGFSSINCGGETYFDPITNITWEKDPYAFGKVGRVNISLPNTTNAMETLRYFPNDSHRRRKYCYVFQASNRGRYLVRASFIYGNYDGLNRPPRFVLILNHDVWENVNTSISINPIVHEIIYSNNGNEINVCLASHLKTTSTPFISTLEIRPLNSTMYIQNLDGTNQSALSMGYGILLWKRVNFGATTTNTIRYPDDQYDRIWEANTMGPKLESIVTNLDQYKRDPSQPPVAVMATAITSTGNLENMSFMFLGYGGAAGFRMELHFEELLDGVESTNPARRNFTIFFPDIGRLSNYSPSSFPRAVVIDRQTEVPLNFQISLVPAATSALGPLLNAVELFHWTSEPLSVNGTFQNDVNAIKEIQAHFKLLQFGQGDPCLPETYEWIWIKCSMDKPLRIVQINLSSFNLTGVIPININDLTSLQKIDLSNNKLSGDLPDFGSLLDLKHLDLHNNNLIGEITPSLGYLPDLTYLDVSNNNLCGSLPSFQVMVNFTYAGNKGLCEGATCNCTANTPSLKKNKKRKYIDSIFSLGALYLMSILAITFIFIYKARQNRKQNGSKSESLDILRSKDNVDFEGLSFVSKVFTYKEISDATLDFTKILGEGGFGKVYYGLLPTGEAIAVKMLASVSRQGLKEFSNEVSILSKVRHKNLVALIGYCVENTYMLIYEYMAQGNIRDLLYGHPSRIEPLSWIVRLHIALDASQGLDYLHTGCSPTIIHRDVKSTNILVSEKMQAKVADFGLSRLKEVDNTTSHVSTVNVLGTVGYLDPVYNATNQLTDKSDVYSFGIVLLELICGRAPIDMFNIPPYIASWASELVMQGRVEEIIDPLLENRYKMESLHKVVDLALQCVDNERSKRPKMCKVSQLLQSALEIEMDVDKPSQDFSGCLST